MPLTILPSIYYIILYIPQCNSPTTILSGAPGEHGSSHVCTGSCAACSHSAAHDLRRRAAPLSPAGAWRARAHTHFYSLTTATHQHTRLIEPTTEKLEIGQTQPHTYTTRHHGTSNARAPTHRQCDRCSPRKPQRSSRRSTWRRPSTRAACTSCTSSPA